MTTDTTRTRVLSVISDCSRVPVPMIQDELNMSQGLGMNPDLTDVMVWDLEDALGIGIAPREYPGPLTTVGEIIRLVEDKVSRLPVGAV